MSPHLGLSKPCDYISEEELTTDEGEDTPLVDIDEEDMLMPKMLGELLIPTDQVPAKCLEEFESTLHRTLSEERKRKRSNTNELPVMDNSETIEISSDLICSALSNIVSYENEIFGQLQSSYSDSTTANCLAVTIAGDDEDNVLLKKDAATRDILDLDKYSTASELSLGGGGSTLLDDGSVDTRMASRTQTESDYAETLNLLHRMQYLENSNADTLDQNFSLRDELTNTHNRNVKLYHDVGTVIQAINEYIAKRKDSSLTTSLPSPLSSLASSRSYTHSTPTAGIGSTVSLSSTAIMSPNTLFARQVASQKLDRPPLSPRSPRLTSCVTVAAGSRGTFNAAEERPSIVSDVEQTATISAAVSPPLASSAVPIAAMTPTFIFGGEPLTRTVSYGSSALRSVDAGLHRSDSIERWGIPMPMPRHT